ncbi:10570_t:CDS:2 [Funneliformis mosseae]|uniref:10570_t:CDS:1 n=1 Tax=Funneliformis mosseae TaxID=27381 RepID=A0A9N8YRD8_FUNMO|nr:10570_t:CDS:2 [Funneliformis mosseae]
MMEQSHNLKTNIFPNEIFQHALALLPLKEIYSFKRVNKVWYRLCDHAIVEHITTSGSKIHVRAGTSKKPKLCYDLNFVGYDPISNIFTFQPLHDNIESTFCYLKHLREIRILFGEWEGVNTTLNKFSPSDPKFEIPNRHVDPQASEVLRRAKLEFHKNYIESLRKVYQLDDEPSLKEGTMISCLGDKDIVLKCHITTALPCNVPNDQLNFEDDDAGGVVYSLKIDFVKVCASWLVSGTTSNFIPEDSRNQIFAPRFNLLDQILAEHNITRYYRYSSIGNFSIRSKVETALEEQNVKKQNMWKYSLVARFLCDPDSYPDPLDMVVDRVVRAERSESDQMKDNNHHKLSRFSRGLYFIKMKFILSDT